MEENFLYNNFSHKRKFFSFWKFPTFFVCYVPVCEKITEFFCILREKTLWKISHKNFLFLVFRDFFFSVLLSATFVGKNYIHEKKIWGKFCLVVWGKENNIVKLIIIFQVDVKEELMTMMSQNCEMKKILMIKKKTTKLRLWERKWGKISENFFFRLLHLFCVCLDVIKNK